MLKKGVVESKKSVVLHEEKKNGDFECIMNEHLDPMEEKRFLRQRKRSYFNLFLKKNNNN